MCRVLSLHVVDDVHLRGVPGQVHQCPVYFHPPDWFHLVYYFLCCSGLKNMYYKVYLLYKWLFWYCPVSCDITLVMIFWRFTKKVCISSAFPAMCWTIRESMQSKLMMAIVCKRLEGLSQWHDKTKYIYFQILSYLRCYYMWI